MRIHLVNKPLNHKLWIFIYLICFLLGFCIQGYGENTRKVNLHDRVTYEWPLYINAVRTIHMWRLIYGKPKIRSHASKIPDHKQPSSDTPQPPGRERQGQPATPQSRPAFLLASVVPKAERQRTDARRSHCATAPRSPGQRALHQTADKLLRPGGEIWS